MVSKFRGGRNSETSQENLEVLTGQRGNGLDRALTLRDLASTELVNVKKSSSGTYYISDTLGSDTSSVVVPSRPTGFEVSGAFSSISLSWDNPAYTGHSYTEIWRGTVESFTDAAMIATTPATVFGDIVSTGSSYYYWIRHVNSKNTAGPYNATLGTLGETSADISEIINDLGEQLRDSELVQWLNYRTDFTLDGLDSSTSIIKQHLDALSEAKNVISQSERNKTNAQITEVQTTIANETNALAISITELTASIEESYAALEQLSLAVANINEDGSKTYQSMWGIKATADEITAGIGVLADSNGTSQVAVSASQFFIFDPNTKDSLTPLFAVSDGAVTIPKAYIEEATIQVIKAQTITADTVKAGISIDSPTINSAVINSAEINIGSGGSYGGYHTKITQSGIIYTDYLVASGGSLDNLLIGENCTIRGTLDGVDGTFTGTVQANKVVGALNELGSGTVTLKEKYIIGNDSNLVAFYPLGSDDEGYEYTRHEEQRTSISGSHYMVNTGIRISDWVQRSKSLTVSITRYGTWTYRTGRESEAYAGMSSEIVPMQLVQHDATYNEATLFIKVSFFFNYMDIRGSQSKFKWSIYENILE